MKFLNYDWIWLSRTGLDESHLLRVSLALYFNVWKEFNYIDIHTILTFALQSASP